MKKNIFILAVTVGIFGFAIKTPAQQPLPDSALMQAAINALQTQRNTALDGQAAAEARAVVLADQLAKANARITELEKLAAVKPKEPGQ